MSQMSTQDQTNQIKMNRRNGGDPWPNNTPASGSGWNAGGGYPSSGGDMVPKKYTGSYQWSEGDAATTNGSASGGTTTSGTPTFAEHKAEIDGRKMHNSLMAAHLTRTLLKKNGGTMTGKNPSPEDQYTMAQIHSMQEENQLLTAATYRPDIPRDQNGKIDIEALRSKALAGAQTTIPSMAASAPNSDAGVAVSDDMRAKKMAMMNALPGLNIGQWVLQAAGVRTPEQQEAATNPSATALANTWANKAVVGAFEADRNAAKPESQQSKAFQIANYIAKNRTIGVDRNVQIASAMHDRTINAINGEPLNASDKIDLESKRLAILREQAASKPIIESQTTQGDMAKNTRMETENGFNGPQDIKDTKSAMESALSGLGNEIRSAEVNPLGIKDKTIRVNGLANKFDTFAAKLENMARTPDGAKRVQQLMSDFVLPTKEEFSHQFGAGDLFAAMTNPSDPTQNMRVFNPIREAAAKHALAALSRLERLKAGNPILKTAPSAP